MSIHGSRRDLLYRRVCLAVLAVLLFFLCRLFPLVGDDWFREALGASLHSPLDLLREVIRRWATVNGRILGNILAYSAGSRPLLREGMRALFTLALIACLSRLTRLDGWAGILLCTFCTLALPLEMFAQIYPWAAGFFNYVPPVVMLLACLELVRPVLEGRPLEEHPARGTALFLLGFGQQLFIENNTLYALCASFVLLVWYRLERRTWSPTLLAFLTGCILGAVLLFASPSYRLIAQDGGAYQSGLGGGLPGLLASAAETFPLLLAYLLLDCPVFLQIPLLPLALTISLLALFRRETEGRKVLLDWLIAGGLSVCLLAVFFYWSPATASVWWLVFAAGLWRWTPDRPSRAWSLFFWLSAPVAAAPLLFVSPIGPRCLFLSYILMLGTLGVLCRLFKPNRLAELGTVLLAFFLFAFCFSAFLPLHQVELARTRAIQEALALGWNTVTIPSYPAGGLLWEPDSAFKMEQYYYRERPGDLAISFAP